jgi:hypothetical protein
VPATPYYYRLHIRNEDDTDDLLVLSSKAGDPNTLLCEAPEGEGQTIDPIMGTLEVGSYTWQAIDRQDGENTYTITAAISNGDARNQLLSHKCIGRYSTDGTEWPELHTGYLNDLKLSDAKTYTFIVGDTDRRERDAVLFKTITTQFDKVSNIIGGPVEAETPVAWGGTPTRSWGPIIDYGPARMVVIANPSGLVNPTERVTLSLTSANLPPLYMGQMGAWSVQLPAGLKWSVPAEYIDKVARPYFEHDADGIYATDGSQQSQPWGSFPQLEAKLRRVSDSAIVRTFPIAQATKKASETLPIWPPGAPDYPIGDYSALVANSNDWLIVAWDVATMGAQPSVGTAFDVWVRPKVISKDNPIHLRGHPIDLHRLANTQEGIPDDAASAATAKAALGGLFYELRITDEWEYSKFTEMLKSSAGYAVRYNADGEQEFFVTRAAQPDEVDTVTPAKIIGDDRGEPQEVIFRVEEGSAIKGVDYTLLSFRLWSEKLDSESERPIDGVIADELTINGKRRDDAVKGSRIVKFDVPGMIMLQGGLIVFNQPLKLREWIIRSGEVIIDRAGWGWADGELEVLATTLGKVGDYLDIEAPHQVNAKVGQTPITQRGGTRKVQIVSRTEMPGTSKIKVKDAGNEAQDAPEAGDSGTGGNDPSGLPVPELSLAPSDDSPFTVATVTLENVDDFDSINADTELQYLVQTAAPAPTDEGAFFGPLASSTGDDEIDAPAILSGETIWVRGRAVSAGVRGEWSDWISITLGPDVDGEGDTLPPISLALAIDPATGELSAVASGVPEIVKVYFLAGAAGGAPPAFADVIATGATDTAAPFTAAALATMAEGETRTVGAVGEDALGNRTQLTAESITRAVNTGAGSGTPGNQPLTWHATPAVVVRNIGPDLFEPKAAIPSRRYLNTSHVSKWRDQVGNWRASPGVEFVRIYSLDRGVTWHDAGPFIPLDEVRFPLPGAFVALTELAVGNNVMMSWGLRGGDGDSVAKLGNIYSDATSSAAPPDSPVDDDDDDTDLPEGGGLGDIIADWTAHSPSYDGFTDGQSAPTFFEESGAENDATAIEGLAAGTYEVDALGAGHPAVRIGADGAGFLADIPTIGTCTWYFKLGNVTGGGSAGNSGPTDQNANLVDSHSGGGAGARFNISVRGDGLLAVAWNNSGGAEGANQTIGTHSVAGPGPHKVRVAWDKAHAQVLVYVDGALDLVVSSAGVAFDMLGVARVHIGNYPTGGSFAQGRVDFERIVVYNATHVGSVGDVVEAAL